MNEQLELRMGGKAPKVDAVQIAAMVQFLEGRGWTKAKDFPEGWTERKVRAIAHESNGLIISGQHGYRLTREASIAEIQHAAAWLRHQADEMRRRALEIDRVYHQKVQ